MQGKRNDLSTIEMLVTRVIRVRLVLSFEYCAIASKNLDYRNHFNEIQSLT